MKKRKTPLRKCIACSEQVDKKYLFRAVRTPDGDIVLDDTGKQNGRGAYLSKKEACIEQAEKKNLLSRHLKAEIPAAIYEEMRKQLAEERNSHV